ncbi:MAG: MBL fold metallo-hydrolase [Deltaproteobacteria bacterium]|nr:MBL fold metallo-hydrolase [Deltaproteobacteria bacterium]
MGFDEILRRRLGPYYPLSPRRDERPDPRELCFRRALGVELRVQPEDSWAECELAAPDRPFERISLADARLVGALTKWRTAAELDVRPSKLWSLVERGVLCWASLAEDRPRPRLELSGSACDPNAKLVRRKGTWPTAALETSVEIAPFPFMPRGRDLDGADLVGVRFDCREKGRTVFGVTLTGSKLTGRILRDLVPLLDRGTSAGNLESEVRGEATAFALKAFDLLSALSLLEPLPAGLRSGEAAEPRISWLGHAAVLLESPRANLLIDPLFFAASEPEVPFLSHPRFDPRSLPPIDAVLITHGDNDHLNPSSLLHLKRTTPVVVPRSQQPALPYQVDMRGILRVLGFEEVIELEAWDVLSLKGVEVTACPFVGEDWGLELAQSTYLVDLGGLRVFASADAARMDETYERVRALGPVDLALMGVGGSAEAAATPRELGYGNFYKDFLPPSRHQQWLEHCAGPEEALESLRILEPRFAFGYAAGGASYIQTEVGDRGDHEELAKRLAAAGLLTKAVSLPLGRPVTRADLEQIANPKA